MIKNLFSFSLCLISVSKNVGYLIYAKRDTRRPTHDARNNLRINIYIFGSARARRAYIYGARAVRMIYLRPSISIIYT